MTTFFRTQWARLRNKVYRQRFVESEVKRGIPFQMRALLKKQRLSQSQLAERAGLTQGAISRALNPNYGNLTLNTIVRIAAGFDVAFIGKFVPFSDLVDDYDEVSEEKLGGVATFQDEDLLLQSDHVLDDEAIRALQGQMAAQRALAEQKASEATDTSIVLSDSLRAASES